MTKRILALLTAVIALLALASVAIAEIDEGEFNDDGTVSSDGKHVTTEVSMECEEGDRYFVRLTITQSETGALAQTRQPGECTGDDQELELSAPGRGNVDFETDEDTEACALVRTRDQGDITGVEQFCTDDINLDEEEEDADDEEEDDDELEDN